MSDPHQKTPEEDADRCEAALARGDVAVAAQHIASALSGDPLRPEWRQKLERILELAPDPLQVFAPEDGTAHYGQLAAHAYALAHSREYQDALELLLQVAAVRPEVPYLAWALEWLGEDEVASTIDPERASAYVGLWLDGVSGKKQLSDEELSGLERLAPVLERLLEVHHAHLGLHLLGASTLRRLGRHAQAVLVARRAYELRPGWHTAANVAMAYRADGGVDSAIVWYERALAHDPEELSARLDLGDMLAEAQRPRDAARWYREALEIEPDHAWATASLCFVNWLEDGDEDQLARLAELAGRDPPNQRALALLSELVRGAQPYLGFLPEPSDATINFLRQMGSGLRDATSVTMAVSAIEPPSARLSFALHIAEQDHHLELEVEVQQVQEPDPRFPSAPVGYLLWEYDGTVPKPAVDPPESEDVIRSITRLASSSFDRTLWAQRGHEIAQRFGREGLRDWVRLMVHPPPIPHGISAWDWVRRVQFAAMFAVAAVDDGWEGSLRREVLRSLLHGPLDWSVEAAVVVIGHLAHTEDGIEHEALNWFLSLASRIPRPGHCCYEAALLQELLGLGSLPDELREPLAGRLKEILESDDDEDEDDDEA